MDASKKTDGQAAADIMSPESATATATDPALEKAIENGFKEEPAPSREERVAAITDQLDHVMRTNSPMTQPMVNEIKALFQPTADGG